MNVGRAAVTPSEYDVVVYGGTSAALIAAVQELPYDLLQQRLLADDQRL